jgi:predicted metalloprotease with PDZ domain
VLGETITSVLQNLGRTKQTLEQSSFEAWTKFYKPDEHSPNIVVSYYTKGELVALCLDVLLIIKTAGKIKLKTIMQYIWQMYGKNKSGLEEGEFEQIASKISGIDLTDFFNLALRSTQDLPIQDLLNQVGVKIHGKNCSDLLSVGIKIADPNTNIINTVLDDSPAQLVGICPLDEIIAINHVKVSNLNSILGTKLEELLKPQNITVHIFRDSQLLEYTLIKNYDYEKTMQKYELELQASKYQSIWLNNDNKF